MSYEVRKVFFAASVFYEKYKNKYRGMGSSFGYFTSHPVSPLNRSRTELILDHVQRISRGRASVIVDFACGGGIIATVLNQAGFRVYGLDLDRNEIVLARAFQNFLASDVQFIVGDSLAPWEKQLDEVVGARPDIVVLGYALHHFVQVEEYIERLGKYMKPGSCVVVNEENPWSLLFQLKNLVRTFLQRDTETEHQRSIQEWKNLFEKQGFELLRTSATDFLPVTLIGKERAWSYVLTFRKG